MKLNAPLDAGAGVYCGGEYFAVVEGQITVPDGFEWSMLHALGFTLDAPASAIDFPTVTEVIHVGPDDAQ